MAPVQNPMATLETLSSTRDSHNNLRKKTSSGDSVPIQPPQQKTGVHRVIDISRYNALPKLLAVTACLKIFQPLSKCEPKYVGPISAKERHHLEVVTDPAEGSFL